MVRFLPYAGWPLAVLLFFLWLDGRENLAAEVERCNADKMAAVAEAEAITRQATEANLQARLTELAEIAERERHARAIAEEARAIAESRPVEVREIIRRVADANACMDTDIPSVVLDELR